MSGMDRSSGVEVALWALGCVELGAKQGFHGCQVRASSENKNEKNEGNVWVWMHIFCYLLFLMPLVSGQARCDDSCQAGSVK